MSVSLSEFGSDKMLTWAGAFLDTNGKSTFLRFTKFLACTVGLWYPAWAGRVWDRPAFGCCSRPPGEVVPLRIAMASTGNFGGSVVPRWGARVGEMAVRTILDGACHLLSLFESGHQDLFTGIKTQVVSVLLLSRALKMWKKHLSLLLFLAHSFNFSLCFVCGNFGMCEQFHCGLKTSEKGLNSAWTEGSNEFFPLFLGL